MGARRAASSCPDLNGRVRWSFYRGETFGPRAPMIEYFASLARRNMIRGRVARPAT